MGERPRWRQTVRSAWPAIRAEIDAGEPAMVGLIRSATTNPLALDLGHQVVGYRYVEAPDRLAIGVYDPNHPGDDSVAVIIGQKGSKVFIKSRSSKNNQLQVCICGKYAA